MVKHLQSSFIYQTDKFLEARILSECKAWINSKLSPRIEATEQN